MPRKNIKKRILLQPRLGSKWTGVNFMLCFTRKARSFYMQKSHIKNGLAFLIIGIKCYIDGIQIGIRWKVWENSEKRSGNFKTLMRIFTFTSFIDASHLHIQLRNPIYAFQWRKPLTHTIYTYCLHTTFFCTSFLRMYA